MDKFFVLYDINKAYNEFEEELISSGYKFFPDNSKKSERIFQKKFSDTHGVKYYITGYHFKIDSFDSYSFNVQFSTQTEKKDFFVDVKFTSDFLPNEYRPVSKIKDVESFYEKLWKNMMFDYYEMNLESYANRKKILVQRKMKNT